MVRPRHVEHRSFERLRHSTRFKAFLAAQASDLGISEEQVFELLKTYTFEQLPNLAVPVNTVAPSFTGTEQVGFDLTYVAGTWTDGTITTWEWYIDGDLVQTEGATLTLLPAHEGLSGFIREYAESVDGVVVSEDSAAFGPIAAA